MFNHTHRDNGAFCYRVFYPRRRALRAGGCNRTPVTEPPLSLCVLVMQPQKNGKNVQKYSAYFVLLNCFSLAKNILVQILNSPVHSSDKTILCALCASLAYRERAIRVPLMMENRFCYKQNFTTNFKNGKVQMTSS